MGAGMDKILPGLYVGSIRDSKDMEQIRKHGITHILSIHEDAREGTFKEIEYLCFKASDHASQDIKQFFDEAIDFIHKARLKNGCVLVHCLAGISRSTTLAVAYVMTVTEMPWYEALNVVRAARKGANPNFGFQRQLQNFEFTTLKSSREKLFAKYPNYDTQDDDQSHCKLLLEQYKAQQLLATNPNNSSSSSSNTASGDSAGKSTTSGNYEVTCTHNAVRTYPLAFNAYGLDKEVANNKPTRLIKISGKNDDAATTSSNDESASLNSNNPLDLQAEKEKIVDKIFG